MAGEIARDLGIHVDGLGRACLVPFEEYLGQCNAAFCRWKLHQPGIVQRAFGNGRKLCLPDHAQQAIAEVARIMGAGVEDAPLGQGQRRGDRHDDAVEPARILGVRLLQPMARRIDHADGVEEDLHQGEHEETAARIARIHGRQLFRVVIRQPVQRLAQIVDQHGKGALGSEWLVIAAEPVIIQPPGLLGRFPRPEIALGARHPRIAFISDPKAGETGGLVADTGEGRPFEGIAPAGPVGEMVLAEADPGELDPRFEGVAIDLERGGEIAKLELRRPPEIGAAALALDHQAAGARIPHIQDQIAVDVALATLGEDIDQTEALRKGLGPVQEVEKGGVAQQRLGPAGA